MLIGLEGNGKGRQRKTEKVRTIDAVYNKQIGKNHEPHIFRSVATTSGCYMESNQELSTGNNLVLY